MISRPGQVGSNLADGDKLGSALTDVDGRSLIASAAMGAIGGPVSGQLLKAGARGLSAVTKGRIGEGLTRVGMAVRGERVIATNRTARRAPGIHSLSRQAGNSRPDYTTLTRRGTIRFVESKFGNSRRLSSGQAALQREVGDGAFRVSGTSYSQVAAAGAVAGGAVGGASGNCAVSRNSPCRQ